LRSMRDNYDQPFSTANGSSGSGKVEVWKFGGVEVWRYGSLEVKCGGSFASDPRNSSASAGEEVRGRTRMLP
jgi:hypothetical protein